MMAKFDFNVKSPFNFGSPTPADSQTKTNRWSTFQNLDKVKDHLKVISIEKKDESIIRLSLSRMMINPLNVL